MRSGNTIVKVEVKPRGQAGETGAWNDFGEVGTAFAKTAAQITIVKSLNKEIMY
jgi:hypothetical protein